MSSSPQDIRHRARALGGALEPVIGQVYFAQECHDLYEALGFGPSSANVKGVAMPDGPAYFTSRGSLLGQVPGEVVAAAFGVFSPAAVVPSVSFGWSITDAQTIRNARDEGALAHLTRQLGQRPDGLEEANELLARAVSAVQIEGRALTAGLVALEEPDHPLGPLFRRGDILREYRGDSHTAAWINAGLTAIEIGLLTELYWGLPTRSYSRSRAWTNDEFDLAEAGLAERGLIEPDSGGTLGFSDAGRNLREQIEVDTDRQMAPILAVLGDDIDTLIDILMPWGQQVRDGSGYPSSGPHDIADRAGKQ